MLGVGCEPAFGWADAPRWLRSAYLVPAALVMAAVAEYRHVRLE
ncbi:Hypotetical protein [Gulosibacter molinativorax]|nr:Hypotetical protein [Gulosibacter molinativorax]